VTEGGSCTLSADCCTGLVCGGNPAVCGAPESRCKVLGESCAGDGDCCSALCAGNLCGTTCPVL
jgi:hypothetical protein